MGERKEVHVSGNGGGTGLGFIVGILIAGIVLFTVLFSLGVFDGKQGADVNIEAPTIETPKAE